MTTTPTQNGVTPFRVHHPSFTEETANTVAPVEPVTVDSPQETNTKDIVTEDTTTPVMKRNRPWPLLVIGAAAAVAVWSGWVGLGQMAGFGVIHPLPGIWDALKVNTAVVLPLSVEAYAAYALRVWLSTSSRRSARTLRFAKFSALASLVIGAGAQIAYHLMEAAGYSKAPWPIVMFVAVIPVIVLGLASALAKLAASDNETEG